MPSLDDSSRSKSSLASVPELGQFSNKNKSATSIPVPTADDLSGPETEETNILPFQDLSVVPAEKRQLVSQQNPSFTRVLTRTLSDTATDVSLKRAPVVIRGEMQRRSVTPTTSSIPHHKRRLYVSLAGLLSLILITGFTLLTVSPLGRDISRSFNPLASNSSMVNNVNTGLNSLVAQATATAVYHQQTDGYVPSSGGSQTVGNGGGSLNWPLGQCTYWANARYHQMSGFWVSWSGNADQWVAGARMAGWNVSSTPHVPSIIVLMPYVQGASGYGHVAVVETILPNTTPTTVSASNMNWYADGGGWDRVSYFDFTVGSGVYFVWR